jgi:hypothetical protein
MKSDNCDMSINQKFIKIEIVDLTMLNIFHLIYKMIYLVQK